MLLNSNTYRFQKLLHSIMLFVKRIQEVERSTRHGFSVDYPPAQNGNARTVLCGSVIREKSAMG